MRALLSRLKPVDWIVVISGLVLVGVIELAKPVAQGQGPAAGAPSRGEYRGPALFDEAAHRVMRDNPAMSRDMRKLFDETFSNIPYFGAFAMAENGAYGWTKGYATGTAARAAALAYCGQHGRGCRVVAEVLPQGVTEAPADSLTFAQAREFHRVGSGIGFRAFARSLDGSWGAARGLTAEEAVKVAVDDCNRGKRDWPDYVPPMPCEAIAVWTDDLLPPPAR